jgi:bifunctional non-homologous end joining protein LigD
MDGVLRSWAVPKGPSYDMADKRLAVKVEDHPLEYGEFEGVIPHGNYGAGGIIVWDRGEWVPLEDWRTGLEKGKLLFELRGYKLHGKWTLVRIKKSDKDWLLIKERDSWVRTPGDQFPEESVLSGLTVGQVKAGETPASRLRRALEESEAKRTRVDPRSVVPMLAEPSDKAFTRAGWLFELKLDGYRLIAGKSNGEAILLTRKGNDYTSVFPEIARAVKALPLDECVIDGEVVVLDQRGAPSFARLQKRGRLSAPMEIRRAAVELPATFFAFDILGFEDFDLRPLALERRKALLLDAIPKLGPVRALEHIEREGEAFLKQVSAIGLEGIIAKKASAPYTGGRSSRWLKMKAEPTADFVVVGFTTPKGSRAHIGALQLADMVGGTLVYAGRVGTGFSDAGLDEWREMLAPIIRKDPPCLGPVTAPGGAPLPSAGIPETSTTTWVEPVHVCEVRYREFTPEGVLRHAAFVRQRADKRPEECERQNSRAAGNDEEKAANAALPDATAVLDEGGDVEKRGADAPAPPGRGPVQKTTTFSNLKKIYWPAEKYTKGDLIDYYRAVSSWLLPYLRNRPVVMTRFPDGIDGKSFYQKDAPEFAPAWIRTVPIWSEDTQRDVRYFVCDDEESLLYIANLGSIPLHIWGSRVGSLELPDWCVIDLDPKDAPFSDVIRTALVLHRLCDSVQLPNYVKTTGKTGLHILIPLGRQCTYEQSRTLGELLARLVLRELGAIATITRHVSKRGDKVYLDYLQNRHGQLIVAPFSVRPLPGATVSMPLVWDEVRDGLDPREHTIRTAVGRMERLGRDPVAPVLAERVDLAMVLGRLATVLAGG